jgi:hypothetical protein
MRGSASRVNEDIAAVAGSCNEKVCAEYLRYNLVNEL